MNRLIERGRARIYAVAARRTARWWTWAGSVLLVLAFALLFVGAAVTACLSIACCLAAAACVVLEAAAEKIERVDRTIRAALLAYAEEDARRA